MTVLLQHLGQAYNNEASFVYPSAQCMVAECWLFPGGRSGHACVESLLLVWLVHVASHC